MKKGVKKKPVFKDYDPYQLSLLPPSLNELIPENHVVRLVQRIIDEIDIDSLILKYSGGGSSSFHPRMMLKIIIYGYISNIYSSRKIEEAVSTNIHFMWLAGMQRPDHNTINRFRTDRLKSVLKEVFGQVVLLMADQGLVDLKTVYVDGTKIEANANKYTFVWGKATKRNTERVKEQLKDLWSYAEKIASEEMKDNSPTTFEKIDSQKVEQTIGQINQALKGKEVDPKVKQKLNYAKNNWPKNLKKYEVQQKLMGDRNSYSKTDPDATFMRMKDDHMLNGQLKAGYNWQISTCNQCILNYDIYQYANDVYTLPLHLETFKELYKTLPEEVVADAGYGSEENYQYLENNELEGYVKYNYFHKEQKAKGKIKPEDAFKSENLYYDSENDFFICPMGQKMEKVYEKTEKRKSGYEQQISFYQAKNCDNCPLKGACHKAKGNRLVQVNHNAKRLKDKARQKLLSPEGIKHRSQRPADVEAVFGNIKQNKSFRRFMLRGKEKVLIETGLLAIAHNIRKMAS